MMSSSQGNFLALDVGERRTGVAIADGIARLPRPLTTLTQQEHIEAVLDIVQAHDVSTIVVGLARRLDGQDSAQTQVTRRFADELKARVGLPVYLQDEAVTSVRAEEELKNRGKPYKKEDIDSLSATYILEDFLSQQAVRDKLDKSA